MKLTVMTCLFPNKKNCWGINASYPANVFVFSVIHVVLIAGGGHLDS